jgi:hypothetical protein
MKINEIGEVGAVMTDANEPILTGKDQVIGFCALHYEIYKGGTLSRRPLVEERHGWAWQTRQRILLLDDEWLDLPGGKKGKRFHEIPFEEATGVVHKRYSVLLHAQDAGHGGVVFEFRPFGAASRLLAWLNKEKEHREMREEGTLESPYRPEDRQRQA